jgi:hypothetical protein
MSLRYGDRQVDDTDRNWQGGPGQEGCCPRVGEETDSAARHSRRGAARGSFPGFLQPSLDVSAHELTGGHVARRGYDPPPAWLLRERGDGSKSW